jgi:1-acyl-sn-glycerol-3-phosphate acyltransferase
VQDWELKPARDHGLTLAESMRSLRRESGLVATGLHIAWWSLVRGYMSVWHRLKVRGRRHVPKQPPFILASNHASHLDALVLASTLPWHMRDQIFPIAAGDVFFETPMMSAFSALFLNALPMWRKKCGGHALQDLRQRLTEEPCAYILFPEGRRSRDGTMGEFKNGLGMLVAGTSVPVIPCHLRGCFEALRPNQRLPRPLHIRVTLGAPLVFENVANDRAGWESIGGEVERAVRALAANGHP